MPTAGVQNRTFKDLFRGTVRFEIPFFQRGYAWEKKQWAQLFLDLQEQIIGELSSGNTMDLFIVVLVRCDPTLSGYPPRVAAFPGERGPPLGRCGLRIRRSASTSASAQSHSIVVVAGRMVRVRRQVLDEPADQVFGIFAALAEFERELIRERTVAGLKAARARGRRVPRPVSIEGGELRKEERLGQQQIVIEDPDEREVAEVEGLASEVLFEVEVPLVVEHAVEHERAHRGRCTETRRPHPLVALRRAPV